MVFAVVVPFGFSQLGLTQFPQVSVLNLTEAKPVLVIVPLNTSVTSVRVRIGRSMLLSCPPREKGLSVLADHPSQLPTPIKLQPLANLLLGYRSDICKILISGFS